MPTLGHHASLLLSIHLEGTASYNVLLSLQLAPPRAFEQQTCVFGNMFSRHMLENRSWDVSTQEWRKVYSKLTQ
jgi:hypothetical protein